MNLRKTFLKLLGYKDQKRYWNTRWKLGIDEASEKRSYLSFIVSNFMIEHDCSSILEIGCGNFPLVGLLGHTTLDFSDYVKSDIKADITKRIPLPDNSFDVVYCSGVLMHVPYDKIRRACEEIDRVGKLYVILNESSKEHELEPHCFFHDYSQYFPKSKLVRL